MLAKINGVFLSSFLFRNEYFLPEGINDGAQSAELRFCSPVAMLGGKNDYLGEKKRIFTSTI